MATMRSGPKRSKPRRSAGSTHEARFQRLREKKPDQLCDRCLRLRPILFWQAGDPKRPRDGEHVCFDCGRKILSFESRRLAGKVSADELGRHRRLKSLIRRVRGALASKGRAPIEIKRALMKIRYAVEDDPSELDRLETKVFPKP